MFSLTVTRWDRATIVETTADHDYLLDRTADLRDDGYHVELVQNSLP